MHLIAWLISNSPGRGRAGMANSEKGEHCLGVVSCQPRNLTFRLRELKVPRTGGNGFGLFGLHSNGCALRNVPYNKLACRDEASPLSVLPFSKQAIGIDRPE